MTVGSFPPPRTLLRHFFAACCRCVGPAADVGRPCVFPYVFDSYFVLAAHFDRSLAPFAVFGWSFDVMDYRLLTFDRSFCDLPCVTMV